MKKAITFLLATFVVGCGAESPGGKTSPPKVSKKSVTVPEVKAEILGWLSAYVKAQVSKTHASGEYPAAQAEMSRHETNLLRMRKENAPLVEKVVKELHQRFHTDRAALQQKQNRLQVVGRELTPEEKEFVEVTAPKLLQQINARDYAFHEFMKFFNKK